MTHRALTLLACVALLAACGDEAAPIDAFSNTAGSAGSAGAAPTPCSEYCKYIVDHGVGCASFDTGGRCVANCLAYASGACGNEWGYLRECVKTSSSIVCQDNGGGTPILVTQGCQDKASAWSSCLELKDAGICD